MSLLHHQSYNEENHDQICTSVVVATIRAVVGANVDVVLCLEFSVLQSTFKKDESERIFMLGYIIQNAHIKDMT